MSAITPTTEQQAAIDAFTAGGTVVVHAGAGTGKTSTLRLLAAARHARSSTLGFRRQALGPHRLRGRWLPSATVELSRRGTRHDPVPVKTRQPPVMSVYQDLVPAGLPVAGCVKDPAGHMAPDLDFSGALGGIRPPSLLIRSGRSDRAPRRSEWHPVP